MKTSIEGVAEIAGHEGIVLSPYRDSVGVWTFGVGHTRAAGPPDPAVLERGVRRPLAVALEIFRQDLKQYEERVGRAVKVPLAQHEFDALVSFDFNTGGILRAKLVRDLNDGNRAAAAAGFDGWHRPPEIISRRDREKRLFQEGVYSHGGMATIYGADANGHVDWGHGTRVNALEILGSPPTSGVPDVGSMYAEVGNTRLPRQPDDPGTDRPKSIPAAGDKVSVAGGVGVALAGALALFGKIALWVAILGAIAGLGYLAWRQRAALGRLAKRIGGRAA